MNILKAGASKDNWVLCMKFLIALLNCIDLQYNISYCGQKTTFPQKVTVN